MNKRNIAIDIAALIGSIAVGTAVNCKISNVMLSNDAYIAEDKSLGKRQKVVARVVTGFCAGCGMALTCATIDKGFKALAKKCKR